MIIKTDVTSVKYIQIFKIRFPSQSCVNCVCTFGHHEHYLRVSIFYYSSLCRSSRASLFFKLCYSIIAHILKNFLSRKTTNVLAHSEIYRNTYILHLCNKVSSNIVQVCTHSPILSICPR